MKIPACFVTAKIDGTKISVWRPIGSQDWSSDHATQIWKQLVLELYSKPVITVLIDTNLVKFSILEIRFFNKAKEELFGISMEDSNTIHIQSPSFGDGNTIEFICGTDGLECQLPWEDDYDFDIPWLDKDITEAQKHDFALLQVMHYMSEWFGDDMTNEISVDVEKEDKEEEDEGDDEDVKSDSEDDKDYTMMDPWVLKLSSGVSLAAKCTRHDGDSDITFVFDTKTCIEATKNDLDVKKKSIRKREQEEKIPVPAKKKVKVAKKPKGRPMPRYLFTKIVHSESVGANLALDVWQLKQNDPSHKFSELNEKHQHKVEVLFQTIMESELEDIIIMHESDDEEDTISFTGEGGKECGPYGTQGLSEMDYLLETIAYRLSKDNSLARRELPKQSIQPDTITPLDLVNGKVAFLEFIAS